MVANVPREIAILLSTHKTSVVYMIKYVSVGKKGTTVRVQNHGIFWNLNSIPCFLNGATEMHASFGLLGSQWKRKCVQYDSKLWLINILSLENQQEKFPLHDRGNLTPSLEALGFIHRCRIFVLSGNMNNCH